MMIDDMDLVREYARSNSEEAFASLVSRHVNLVYSVSLRHVHDAHLAEEVTQTVFVILARKAASFGAGTVVSGWLCRTARYVSAKALTLQRRRALREQQAYMESQSDGAESDAWMRIEPLLETAMAQLGEKDHNAVVLRFFEGRSFKDVSAALGTSEAAAKMRVNRALEKLRRFFAARGLTLSAAVIAGAVSANSVHGAPIGLAASATAAAVKGATVTSSTLTLIQTTLKFMALTKLKTAVVVGALAIIAAGTATVTLRHLIAPAGAAKATPDPSPFTFAGYATPETSIQSMLWAASKGDLEKLSGGVTPEEMRRFKDRMEGKSDDEVRHGLIGWANGMVGYKVTEKEAISGDEVHLHIHATPSAEALHSGKVVLVMKKVGNEWKEAGNAN
jgi:RNA polymerase sigma factor (sigma-70 family)